MADRLDQPTTIIVLDKSGRLGNKLNLFAHFIAFGLEHRVRIVFPGFAPYRDLFESTRNSRFCQIVPPDSPAYAETVGMMELLVGVGQFPGFNRLMPGTDQVFAYRKEDYCDLSQPQSAQRLLSNTVVFAHGYFFRCFDDISDHAGEIRDILSPVQEYRGAAERFIASNRNPDDVVIGVHIRHGDYARWQRGRHFFTVAQYRNIMGSLQALWGPSRVVYVVSSDTHWTEEDFPGLEVVIVPPQPMIALHCLSLCDYLVGPKSSFNRWASFYGDVPLYTIRDPEAVIQKTDFRVNYLDDRQAIFHD